MKELPYGLTLQHVKDAVRLTEDYFKAFEGLEVDNRPPLLSMLQANAISGLVSDIVAHSLCIVCATLVKNGMPGGYPDLLDSGSYSTYDIKYGLFGIEVKSSKNAAWQGHNPESGWLMAIGYSLPDNSKPLKIDTIYLSNLEKHHWTFCPRGQNSKRTPTAKVNRLGMKILKESVIYDSGG